MEFNKRQNDRVGHNMLTELQQNGQHQTAVAIDFSVTGIKLALTQSIEVDKEIFLLLALPIVESNQPLLLVKARVAWQHIENGILRCGAEFIGLSSEQKERIQDGVSLVKKLLAVSVASVCLAAPTVAGATTLSAAITADQIAVSTSLDKVQTNLSKVVQDVLNIQTNTAGANNAGLNMMYNASLAINVAALAAEGSNFAKVTQKLTTDAAPITSANNTALAAAQKSGNSAAIQKAATQANTDLQTIYGTLVPTLTAKVQSDINTLAKNAVKYGSDLIAKTSATDKAAALAADKVVMAGTFTNIMTDVVAMKPVAPPTPAATAVNNTVAAVSTALSKLTPAQIAQLNSLANMFNSLLSGASKAAPSAVPPTTVVPTTAKLMGGIELTYLQSDSNTGYAMLTDMSGTTTAIGYGTAPQYSSSKALYNDSNLAELSNQLNESDLSKFASGGAMFAYGTKLSNSTRVAVSWSASGQTETTAWTPNWQQLAKANNLEAGVSQKVGESVTAGLNIGVLTEKHGLLGSTYDPNSLVSFGDKNHTASFSASIGGHLTKDTSVMIGAGLASTKGSVNLTNIQSRSYGVSLVSRNLVNADDKLTVTVSQPLHVVAGQVAIAPGTWIDLTTRAHETDAKIAYDTVLKGNQTLNLQATMRQNLENVAGKNDVSVGVAWSMKF